MPKELENIPICVANGDGVGPELIESAMIVLRESGAKVHMHFVEIGLHAFHFGFEAGIAPSCIDTIKKYPILLKAPTLTPDGERHALPMHGDIKLNSYNLDLSDLSLPSTYHSADVIITKSDDYAVFEPALDAMTSLADMNMVNPSGMICTTALMLCYIGQVDAGLRIGNALLSTIEDGMRTEDMYVHETSKELLTTEEFTEHVCSRLGKVPTTIETFNAGTLFV